MNDRPADPISALRALANRWTVLARDYARDAKAGAVDDPRAHFNRGLAEGYYKAAVDLAELVKTMPELTGRVHLPAPPAQPPAPVVTTAAAMLSVAPVAAVPVPDAPAYARMGLNEVLDILSFAGTNPREVKQNPGTNTFTAIFSRWEPLMPHERVALLQKADFRLVIVESGKTRDTSDPFVEIAFRAP